MIVVEGPDGSGKTTLCKNICEDFNLAMGERSTRDRDKLYEVTRTDTARAIYEELKCDAPPLVWDRLGPISDPIYAPIQGRKTGFNFNEQRFFFCTLQYLSLMILCLPPLETVIENSHKEHQMRGVTGNEELIYRHYRQLHPPPNEGCPLLPVRLHTPELQRSSSGGQCLPTRKKISRMLVIFDTCNIGLAGEPSGGVTFIYKEIGGMPPDVQVMVPIVREQAEKLIEGMQDLVNKVKPSNLEELRRMTRAQTPPTPSP